MEFPYTKTYEIGKQRERRGEQWGLWHYAVIDGQKREPVDGYVSMSDLGSQIANDWRQRVAGKEGHYSLHAVNERGGISTNTDGVRVQRAMPTEEELATIDLIVERELAE